MWDTARGIGTFHDADTPPAPGPAVAANTVGASADAGDGGSSEGDADDDGDCGDNTDDNTEHSRRGGLGILLGRGVGRYPGPARSPPPVLSGTIWAPLGTAVGPSRGHGLREEGLSPDDMKVLEVGLKARSAYVDVPDVLMMSAKFRHEGMRLPENLRQALE